MPFSCFSNYTMWKKSSSDTRSSYTQSRQNYLHHATNKQFQTVMLLFWKRQSFMTPILYFKKVFFLFTFNCMRIQKLSSKHPFIQAISLFYLSIFFIFPTVRVVFYKIDKIFKMCHENFRKYQLFPITFLSTTNNIFNKFLTFCIIFRKIKYTWVTLIRLLFVFHFNYKIIMENYGPGIN